MLASCQEHSRQNNGREKYIFRWRGPANPLNVTDEPGFDPISQSVSAVGVFQPDKAVMSGKSVMVLEWSSFAQKGSKSLPVYQIYEYVQKAEEHHSFCCCFLSHSCNLSGHKNDIFGD